MSQERNNRKQGQRIRRINENVAALIEGQEQTCQVVGQHDRDIKFIKTRLDALERHNSVDPGCRSSNR